MSRFNYTPRSPRPLSPREKDCLHWVAMGKTTEEIGMIMGLSQHTVNFHLRNACKKLNASNRYAAIANAFHAAIFIPCNSSLP